MNSPRSSVNFNSWSHQNDWDSVENDMNRIYNQTAVFGVNQYEQQETHEGTFDPDEWNKKQQLNEHYVGHSQPSKSFNP